MKNKIWFTLLAILFFSANIFAQDEIKLKEFKADLLIVRTFEVLGGAIWNSKISISDGSGEIWSLDLRGTRPRTVDENLTTIVKVLNQVKIQGYNLVHTNSGGANDHGVFISNYIFEKRKE
jgi:hypothetical protein